MRELLKYGGPTMRVLCFVLGTLVVWEFGGIIIRWNPFRGVAVPELPGLTVATNSLPGPMAATNRVAATEVKGTNHPPQQRATNSMPTVATTTSNLPALRPASKTNPATQVEPMPLGTNMTTKATSVVTTNAATNMIVRLGTNSTTGMTSAAAMLSTNGGTNLFAAAAIETNAPTPAKPKKNRPGAGPAPEMAGTEMIPGLPGRRGADLAPAIQSQIRRITDSEILAPVMHPLPMALLGIAGEVAFLRSDSGQTGLVKEGDSLDDIKLLRIGVNRVLIEQGGQKKELMIFSGYGGDSLLPKESTNENNHP